ncbi:MAG: phosphatidyl-myo-inositol alpha-mannosyltransferase, partial [Thermoleophilaceae bacterium]|nr:phosphatidyl-myo-inositol alpha-mannosyltransferase [Thermoleophilaceae bacterium]
MLHRGAAPERRPAPDYLIPLGRTFGLPMNGAVTNLSSSPEAIRVLGRELRYGGYDVVHVHEPNVPVISWFAADAARAPTVATFHTYSTSWLSNSIAANVMGARRIYSKLSARIAVSEAAEWTARRFYGGRYRIVPNGVDLSAARPSGERPHERLEILFIGRAEGRKGLPVLLRAFEALRGAGVDARLTVAGATDEEVAPLLLDTDGVEVAGRVSEEEKWRLLGAADLLCAPSLGGESFGMVLTEAFASSTPVVASRIAGYRNVVRSRQDGLLVPPGDAVELGEALRDLALDPERRQRMASSARERAERFAWPQVTGEVAEVYEEALAQPQPERRAARVASAVGARPAESGPRLRPRRLATLEPKDSPGGRRRAARLARRGAVVAGAVAGIGLTALALERIGLEPIGRSLLAATPMWVLVAFALMCASMLLRAEAWHAILRAALPGVRVRRRDTARGTMIGVLMSATMPARLGEPSRALIVARRLGRMRDRFPVVLGTIVSQTLLNIFALIVLGGVMFATVGIFRGREDALVIVTVAPLVLLALVIATPWLLRRGKPTRFQRAQQATAAARGAMLQVRSGLQVFRRPKLGGWAAVMQLTAWAIQWLACYVLLVALGLDERAGIGAAAAVLFAVNVTAAIPATPSNLGVFQA